MEGWKEEEWVGSKFAASTWIYTKAVVCDGRGQQPPLDLRLILRIIMESASCVIEDFLWEHEWVTEPNVLSKENDILETLTCDFDVLCHLQWRLLCSPLRQTSKMLDSPTKNANCAQKDGRAYELKHKIHRTETKSNYNGFE